jgi:hypothetical protein
MQVNRATLRIIEVVLGTLVAGGVLLVGWWLLSLNTDTTEAQIRAQMTRLKASAEVYYSRLQYYQGVCADIGVPAGYSCHDSDTAFAVEVPAGPGSYLCMDSQGFFGHTHLSKGQNTACRRY